MTDLFTGAITMGSLVIALFFLRFWRSSGDRFFIYFALSFFIEGLHRLYSAVHDNGGVTWTRHLGTANSTLSGTLGYSMIECRSCQGWLMAGLDLNTEFWTGDVGHVSGRPVTIGTGLRVSGGIARYLGAANARASTLALLVPVDASVPALRGSRVHGTFVTGIGIGSVASDRVAQGAALPILGWSVGWSPVSQLGLNFGFQRVLLALERACRFGQRSVVSDRRLGAVRLRAPLRAHEESEDERGEEERGGACRTRPPHPITQNEIAW